MFDGACAMCDVALIQVVVALLKVCTRAHRKDTDGLRKYQGVTTSIFNEDRYKTSGVCTVFSSFLTKFGKCL